MTNTISPCLHCTRVKDAQNCENKNCKPWRQWFLERWEYTRRLYRKGMDQCSGKPGVPLGGRRYCQPHQITAYLQEDPCQRCKLPRDLCHTPCKLRTQWEAVQKEVTDELESRSH